MAFSYREVMPGVYHIQDALGVCMTLLDGRDRALLVDTGYGLENVGACVRGITQKPVSVLLTHGHHDHALGSRWFEQVCLLPEDRAIYRIYTGRAQRELVLQSARSRGIETDEGAFLNAAVPPPLDASPGDWDLGGMTARVIHCPGHTPGSAVVYVPERGLLLTGDDWNPCTWLFFPEALCVQDYRRHLRALQRLPFSQVLCSHQVELYDRRMLDAFLDQLTDERLSSAAPVDAGNSRRINTREAQLPFQQTLVFDWDKFDLKRGEETEKND